MNFTPFDTTEMDNYAAEAKAKWGKTGAYKEFENITAGQSSDRLKSSGDGLMAVFTQIGNVRHLDPASEEVQVLVAKLQRFITDHYYTCTRQILQGLGQMYVADERFRQSIDRAGGEGTAEFAAKAIKIYCK